MYRLFVGISIPSPIKEQLSQLAGGVPGARWLEPGQIHMTLRFIGEVDGSVFRDVGEALFEIEHEPFDLTIKGVGVFPPRKEPRVLWAGVETCNPLYHLQKKVESVLVRSGIEPDGRKFTPHVAIARLRDIRINQVANYLAEYSLFRVESFTVEEFCLFSSQLGSEGASYQIEEQYRMTRKARSESG